MADYRERVLFSTSSDYFPAAERELRDLYGAKGAAEIERLGPDLGRISGGGVRIEELARACREEPLAFIRHLTVERAAVSVEEAADLDAVGAVVRRVAEQAGAGELAVQCWISGQVKMPYGTAELAQHSMKVLSESGIATGRAGLSHALSLCLTDTGLLVGTAAAAEQLSDWPGGRIRLSRSSDQISRAEFKLEEAVQVFGITPPADGSAVDLGASPGGWTRVLRSYGMSVWAIDPGDLDDRLRHDPGVRHVRTTAGEFFRSERQRFDMVVNDMKMAPELSCKVMLAAAERLRPGALAVLTLKLGPHRPVETVRRCLRLLDAKYTVRGARQLHHNRHEVTVVAERR
ncbi:SAM-dependent methyltransferase [Nocardia terpenica]|uniref:SAM-dependent methyltransferase n=1 Tax=Nocardia terpenica TaxID=455432 RepID=UPI0018E0BE33|nr:SAM-dependent methyltransferase [Nocardia terpenica]